MRKRKAHGLLEPMTDFLSLKNAFKAASAGKRNRLAVMSFRVRLEENLFQLSNDLRAENYGFGPYRSFYIHEPKTRLIESACFRDRVVHHAIYKTLEPIFDAQFYEYSFACRTGRGTHKAMLTLHDWVRRSKLKTFLKCDIRKFFPSMDRTLMMSFLKRSIADEKLLRLLEKLVMNAPRSGIPIGNLTSQLFANIYMNELDQFVKRKLRVRYYIRYMDDFILLCETPREGRRLRDEIEEFLRTNLKLELSPEKVMIGQVDQGIPFVGYCQRPKGIRVRGAPLRRSRKKVRKAFKSSFGRHYEMEEDFWTSTKTRQSRFYGSWSSFVGQTKYANDGLFLQQKLAKELELLPP